MRRRELLAGGLGVAGSGLTGCLSRAESLLLGASWGFEDVARNVGLRYASNASGIGNGNAGVYVSDYDDDGWPDVLAIGGEEPALFRNTGGEFVRTDALSDIDATIQGAVWFDADRDGLDELLLLPRNGRAVFFDNTDGTLEREENALSRDMGVAVGATAADYTGNGALDVFVIQYGDWGKRTPAGFKHPEGGHVAEDNGAPNLLFRNTGDGFEVATDAGITGEHWSLAASFVDLTGSGDPDIHVANDFNNDILYRNLGDGTFDRVLLGEKTARNGMSSEVGDFTGDGRPDIFVTNIFFPLDEADLSEEKRARLERYFSFVLRSKRIGGNNLLINEGGAEFRDAADEYNVSDGGWGWAAVYEDLDNDGRRELFHGTQKLVRLNEADPHYTFPMIWREDGNGFEKLDAAELGFEETNDRGVARIDFDRDGDLDLLIATYDGELKLYENNANAVADRHSLQVEVLDQAGSGPAIGAEVAATIAGDRQYAFQTAGADYQSQNERLIHFGLGETPVVERLTVSWPDGTERSFNDVAGDQRIQVRQDGDLQPIAEW